METEGRCKVEVARRWVREDSVWREQGQEESVGSAVAVQGALSVREEQEGSVAVAVRVAQEGVDGRGTVARGALRVGRGRVVRAGAAVRAVAVVLGVAMATVVAWIAVAPCMEADVYRAEVDLEGDLYRAQVEKAGAAPGRSSFTVVAHQRLAAEGAHDEHETAVALMDLVKAYELVPLHRILGGAIAFGFPVRELCVVFAVFACTTNVCGGVFF
jgi:hypothetical protein